MNANFGLLLISQIAADIALFTLPFLNPVLILEVCTFWSNSCAYFANHRVTKIGCLDANLRAMVSWYLGDEIVWWRYCICQLSKSICCWWVQLWNVRAQTEEGILKPIATRKEHTRKVRALKFNAQTKVRQAYGESILIFHDRFSAQPRQILLLSSGILKISMW